MCGGFRKESQSLPAPPKKKERKKENPKIMEGNHMQKNKIKNCF